MRILEFFRLFKSREHRRAFAVALAADAIQIVLLPLFVGGAASPADVITEIGAAVVLSRILGWHWAFLPALLAELVPGIDLFPTWTAAVLFVAWERARVEPSVGGSDEVPGGRIIDIR
ncbi:MAG TPA: hypothetical protein VFY29_00295 [Terriglobia bacterium]|nr:hypothetical protein [Terriglobia bacterium]